MYRQIKITLVVVTFTFYFGESLVQAQFSISEGLPFIRNFTPEQYNGHVQNWGFTQDSAGIIYVANLTGVLYYNGVSWSRVDISNGRAFSLDTGSDDRVYVGGANEFGYLDTPSEDTVTTLQYYSLSKLLPDTLSIGTIWQVHDVESKIYFRSNDYLFQYDMKTEDLTYFTSENGFSYLYSEGSKLFIRDYLSGLYQLKEKGLVMTPGGEFFAENVLRSRVNILGKEVFCAPDGCFQKQNNSYIPFPIENLNYLEENYIDEVIALDNETMLFATRRGGIVNVDAEGNLIHILNEENGLINNTVYGLFEDRTGAVWAATVNGISRIEYSLPFRVFDERSGIQSLVRRISVYKNEFYASSVSGIYSFDKTRKLFSEFKPEHAPCSNFFVASGSLYVICSGAIHFQKEKEFFEVELSLSVDGVAFYDRDLFFLSSDGRHFLVRLDNTGIDFLHQFEGINNELNSIHTDRQKNIWIGTEANGLYRVQFQEQDGEVTGQTIKNYFSNLDNEGGDKRVNVSELDGEPAFLTWGKGIQRYNPEKDSLEMVTKYGEVFTDTTRQIFWAEEDYRGNIWFRSGQEYQAAMIKEDGSYQMYEGVLKRITEGQSNTIYPDEYGNVWYSIDEKLIRYDVDHDFDHTKPYHTQISKVLVRNDSLINGGSSTETDVLEYRDNELRFTYAAASYDAPEKTQYRVQLVGFDEGWGPWTSESQKDYTNIPEGDYHFRVQARNVYGTLSTSDPFYFSVLPPWYRTWWAYLIYVMLGGSVLYAIYRVRIYQIMKVQRIRNRIASDLHDEVSATLSSISYFAQAIGEERIKEDKYRFVNLIRESAGDAKEKITDIVWAINPDHDDWKSFLSKCRRFASDLLESKDMSYSLKIDENMPGKLEMQFRQHLWLIYKEMVTNAVRHSEADQLDVIITNEHGKLKLVVQDNGKGMNAKTTQRGNGLINIRKRAEQLKAEVKLDSDPGMGTRWVLKVNV